MKDKMRIAPKIIKECKYKKAGNGRTTGLAGYLYKISNADFEKLPNNDKKTVIKKWFKLYLSPFPLYNHQGE